MIHIWRYVLRVDKGIAPNPNGGLLTLACCKPIIRKYALEGEWVVGFCPKRLGKGKVAWAGQVTHKLRLGEYYDQYNYRADAIYRAIGRDELNQEILEPLTSYHSDTLSKQRDKNGRMALVCEKFWYWGGSPIDAPEFLANLARYGVGQAKRGHSLEDVKQLETWLMSLPMAGKLAEPRHPFDPIEMLGKCLPCS